MVELAPVDLEAAGREVDSSLESAVGNLDAVDRGAARANRKLALADDDQTSVVDHDLHLVGLDTRQGDQNLEFAVGLEQIDRRLPGRPSPAGCPELEILPMQPLCPLEKVASVSPHPGRGI